MSRSQQSQRGRSLISSSFRAISSVANTLRSAGASIASSISAHDEDRRREQVQWAGFDKLELLTGVSHRILLIAYTTGFQVWDIEDADNVCEVVSRRDGPVAFLQMQPQPITLDAEDSGFIAASPLLLVVGSDAAGNEGNLPGALGRGYSTRVSPESESSSIIPTVVCFYSMRTHAYVHKLRFREAVFAVRCSPRIVAVSLRKHICCYNAATLQLMFNVPTYPIPQGGQGPGSVSIGYGPMDVGLRWLAYVATHAFVSNSGRISPQSVSLSTSPLNGSSVAHYAKESSKHIAAGIATLGDKGYKTLTKYCSELLPDSFSPPGSVSVNASVGHSNDPKNVGMVVVKDFVNGEVVAQFRPHTSPISALCFDPSGTLLVTASIYGHNLNIFRIMPFASGNSPNTAGSNVIHLYKLVRGVTNAVIQDISFSDDSQWIAISSSRGTSHLFVISPFGGMVGPHNRGGILVDGSIGSPLVQNFTAMCPCTRSGLLKGHKQYHPPLPITLSVVCKIKNGNEGWCSTMSGAAAAARGKLNVSSVAVAAVFHNGGNQFMESQLGNSDIKNQFWVFSSCGHVIRYALHPYAAPDSQHCSNNAEIACSSGLSQLEDLRVVPKPLQKWDVGRKSNCEERELDIHKIGGTESNKEEMAPLAGYKSGRVHPQSGEANHCLHLSNAEVHTHPERSSVWAKPEINFHMIHLEIKIEEGSWLEELEIEKLPTHAVEIKSKELKPVFEHGQGARNNVSGSQPDASTLVVNQFGHVHTQNGMNGIDVGHAEIQHSNGFSVQTNSTKQSAFANHVWHSVPAENDMLESPRDDVSQMQACEESINIDRESKDFPFHADESGKEDSIRGTGDLEIINEEDINGLVACAGTNGNQMLSLDDNSESFDSNPFDVGEDSETISPSSVLQTKSIPNKCLNMLQGNVNSKLQGGCATIEHLKSVDSYTKEGTPTSGENGEDDFDGPMFPFFEEE